MSFTLTRLVTLPPTPVAPPRFVPWSPSICSVLSVLSEWSKYGWKWKLVTQSCPTLCDPMDCSPPGSSVHGILQARILEWAAISFSSGSSQPRDQTQVTRIAGRLYWLSHQGSLVNTDGSTGEYGPRPAPRLLRALLNPPPAPTPLACALLLNQCQQLRKHLVNTSSSPDSAEMSAL